MITAFSLLRRALSRWSLFVRTILASLLLLFLVSLPRIYLSAQENLPTAPSALQRAEQPIVPKGKASQVKPKPGAPPDDSRKDNTFFDWVKFSAWIVMVGAAGFAAGCIVGRATAPRTRAEQNSGLLPQLGIDLPPPILIRLAQKRRFNSIILNSAIFTNGFGAPLKTRTRTTRRGRALLPHGVSG
jgi:hypothetical protein